MRIRHPTAAAPHPTARPSPAPTPRLPESPVHYAGVIRGRNPFLPSCEFSCNSRSPAGFPGVASALPRRQMGFSLVFCNHRSPPLDTSSCEFVRCTVVTSFFFLNCKASRKGNRLWVVMITGNKGNAGAIPGQRRANFQNSHKTPGGFHTIATI